VYNGTGGEYMNTGRAAAAARSQGIFTGGE